MLPKKNKVVFFLTDLARNGFTCAIRTSKALPELATYLLTNFELSFVLLGKISSDPIEHRFERYRQLSGANYHISTKQILSAQKSIRIQSLIRFSQFNIKEVKDIFKECQRETDCANYHDIAFLLTMLPEVIDGPELTLGDQNVILYVAGYISRSLTKKMDYRDCYNMLVKSSEPLNVTIDEESTNKV